MFKKNNGNLSLYLISNWFFGEKTYEEEEK